MGSSTKFQQYHKTYVQVSNQDPEVYIINFWLWYVGLEHEKRLLLADKLRFEDFLHSAPVAILQLGSYHTSLDVSKVNGKQGCIAVNNLVEVVS